MIEKRYKFKYDLFLKKIYDIKFQEGDTESAVLEVNLTENGIAMDLTDQIIEFRFIKADKNVVTQDIDNGVTVLDAVAGKVECILKNDTLSFPGNVHCEIYRSGMGRDQTIPAFNFTVSRTAGENGVISGNYISSIESKIIEWQTEFSASEVARTNTFTDAESTRVDIFNLAETERAAAEILRENTTDAIKLAYDNATKANTSLEVVAARLGEVDLKTKLEKVDTSLAEMSPQVTNNDTSKKYSYKLQINSGKPQLILEEVI